MALRSRITTTRPMRKMMPTVLPRNLSMRASGGIASPEVAVFRDARPSGETGWPGRRIGSREWDRTTDHLHVKEVLYH
jgi:hypothetical protein